MLPGTTTKLLGCTSYDITSNVSEKSLPLPLTYSRANVIKVNCFCFYSTLKLNKSLNAVLSEKQ